jgi:hypothetical protein
LRAIAVVRKIGSGETKARSALVAEVEIDQSWLSLSGPLAPASAAKPALAGGQGLSCATTAPNVVGAQ